MKILIADDDDTFRQALADVIASFGHECITVADGEAAWEQLDGAGADVVISDWGVPGLSGVELCELIRATPRIAYPYFILLSARSDHADTLAGLRAGADDHMVKPPALNDLEARLIVAERVRALHLKIAAHYGALEVTNVQLRIAAHRDALTGLGNRLLLSEDLPGIHARFVREGARYNIVLLDIDHFKSYNDRLGHQAGDTLLAEVGRAILAELREGDLAYRYGGEEFLLVLPNHKVDNAAAGTERVRREIARRLVASGLPGPPTLSAGLAASSLGESLEEIIGRADAALYRAKHGGRNRLAVDRTAVTRTPPAPDRRRSPLALV